MDLITSTERGLYCPPGDFYLDPWRAVDRAVITHAHTDHARWGCGSYLTSAAGEGVLRVRLGPAARIDALPYGREVNVNGVSVSLHPAGHLLGSAQVRVEHRGEVWVFSGDYKRQWDPTCAAFEPVRCHAFITESTFGLPIYRWRPTGQVMDEINAWWRGNVERGWTSILFTYALGKAQRLIASVDAGIGPILVHGAVDGLLPAYEAAGVRLPETRAASPEAARQTRGRALVIAPPAVAGTPWMKKFAPASTAMVSGWTLIRGARRRRNVDRGFAVSDHADWDALLTTVRETGAGRVFVTHGYAAILAKYLREQGLDAREMASRYGEETDEEAGAPEAAQAESPAH